MSRLHMSWSSVRRRRARTSSMCWTVWICTAAPSLLHGPLRTALSRRCKRTRQLEGETHGECCPGRFDAFGVDRPTILLDDEPRGCQSQAQTGRQAFGGGCSEDRLEHVRQVARADADAVVDNAQHRLSVTSLQSDDDLTPGRAVVDGVVDEAAHHVGEAALVPGADDGLGMGNELELMAGVCWRLRSDQPLDQR